METTMTTRYSATDLNEFKQLILSKLDAAQSEYKDLMATLDGSAYAARACGFPK